MEGADRKGEQAPYDDEPVGLRKQKEAARPRGEDSKPPTGGHTGVTEISAPDRGSRTCKGRRHSISTSELQVTQNAWFRQLRDAQGIRWTLS